MVEINKLSQKKIEALKTPGRYRDGENLYLNVRSEHSKSWLFRYSRNKKPHWLGLGAFPATGLADARKKAAEWRALLDEGKDPAQARQAQRVEEEKANEAEHKTFKAVAELYVADRKAGWKNEKHGKQWLATIEAYANPKIGKLAVAAIETKHVLDILRPIWSEKNETASRVRGRIETVLNYANTHGWRNGEVPNPARWHGHLQNVLPKPSDVKTVRHYSALPWREIGDFMPKLEGQAGVSAMALRFGILCASRSGEVRGLTWSEIDLENAVWTVPASRMKAGREHRVPLSEPALAILAEMSKLPRDPAGLIFPGMKPGKPLSDMSLTAVLRRMERGDLTAHGFRSCFRDWAGETGQPSDIAEAALAHTLGNKVQQAYQRGDLMERRKHLMAAWARFCGQPASGNVVALSRGEAA